MNIGNKRDRDITAHNLVQLIQENTVCVGQQGFYRVDYSFISQVSFH